MSTRSGKSKKVRRIIQQLEKKLKREQRRKNDLEEEHQRFKNSQPTATVAETIVTFVEQRLQDPILDPENPYTQAEGCCEKCNIL